jgi:hypothetical protein
MSESIAAKLTSTGTRFWSIAALDGSGVLRGNVIALREGRTERLDLPPIPGGSAPLQRSSSIPSRTTALSEQRQCGNKPSQWVSRNRWRLATTMSARHLMEVYENRGGNMKRGSSGAEGIDSPG